MRELTYWFFNAVIFVPVLILSITTDVKIHKQWRAFIVAFLCVSLPFIIWDIWAVSAGHWYFSSIYITHYRLLNLPPEEILFFFTVPFAMMYIWGVIKKYVSSKEAPLTLVLVALCSMTAVVVTLLLFYWHNGYTRSALLALSLTLIILACTNLVYSMRFWVYQALLLIIFIIANAFLTALPVISYGTHSIIGIHFATIPLEDFFFNFAFLTLFLIVFNTNETKLTQL